MKATNTTELIAQIVRTWPFDKDNYPEIPEGRDERLAFALSHVAKHLTISQGDFLKELEPVEHGEPITMTGETVLRNRAFHFAFQALRIFALLDISFQEFVEYMAEKERKEDEKREQRRMADKPRLNKRRA